MRAADNVNPHGIPRPSRVDLARAFLVRVADVLDVDDVDGAALETLVHALDWLDVLDDPRAADVRDAVHARGLAIGAGAYGPAALDVRARLADVLAPAQDTAQDTAQDMPRGRWIGRMHVSADMVHAMLDTEDGPADEVHPCRYGHLECSTTPRGRCSNETAAAEVQP